jgi:hypothetical protein
MDSIEEKIKTGLEQENLKDLDITRKWAMFISILGFIGVGVLLIVGIFAVLFLCIFNKGDTSTTYPGWFICSVLIASAVLYFFPVLYLFRFSKNMSDTVKTPDRHLLTKAFRNLKYCFRWFGILMIVAIVLYVITFFVLGSSVTFLKDMG